MLDKYSEGLLTERNKVVSIAISGATAAVMPAMQIQYIGNAAAATVTVNITTGDIVLKHGATAETTVLTCDVSDAAYNTFGLVRDAINATGIFRCFLIGALPSETSTAVLDTLAATSCKTDNGLTIYYDLALEAAGLGAAITNNKFISRPNTGETYVAADRFHELMRKGWTKDTIGEYNSICRNSIDYLYWSITETAGGNITIYAVDDLTDTETLLFTNAYASGTAEEHGSSDPADPWLAAPDGQRIVVRCERTTVSQDITAGQIIIHGKTRDLTGGEVPSNNYTGCA